MVDIKSLNSLKNTILVSINNPLSSNIILELLSIDSDQRDHFNLRVNNVNKVYYQRFESSIQREGFRNLKRIKLRENHPEWVNQFTEWKSAFTNENGFELLLYNGSILRFVGDQILFEKEVLEDIQTLQDEQHIPDHIEQTSAKIVSNISFAKPFEKKSEKELVSSDPIEIPQKDETVVEESLEAKEIEILQQEAPLSEITIDDTGKNEISEEIEETEIINDILPEEDSINHEDPTYVDVTSEAIPLDNTQEQKTNFETMEMETADQDISLNKEADVVDMPEYSTSREDTLEQDSSKDSLEAGMEAPKQDLFFSTEVDEVNVSDTPLELDEIDEIKFKDPTSEDSVIEEETNNDNDLAKFMDAIVTEETIEIQGKEESPQLDSSESKPKGLLEQIDEDENHTESTSKNVVNEKKNDIGILLVNGVNKNIQNNLISLGYDTIEKLAKAKINHLIKISGIGKVTARKIIQSAKDLSQD